MYDKISITENTLRVLSLFTAGFNVEFYVREVERLTGVSPRTAQLILEDLENKGVLRSKLKGKVKLYVLSRSDSAKRFLVFVEQYKLIVFLEKNMLIKEIVEKISVHIKGVGVVFGSYVKGLEKNGSDLDIFVVGDYDVAEIKKISQSFGVEVSVKCYPMKVFKKNVDGDFLLKEILMKHVIFVGVEQFVEVVFNEE